MKKLFRWGILLLSLFAFEFDCFGQTDTIWVPIKVHILKRSDNTPINTMNASIINNGLAYANRKFKDAKVQFFFCAIDSTSSELHDDTNYNFYWDAFKLKFQINLRPLPSVNDALNLYLVPNLEVGGGSASYPTIATPANSKFFVKITSNEPYFCYALTHELGHMFFLLHTFYGSKNSITPSNIELQIGSLIITPKEKIARTGILANCDIGGDLICDTDADYYPQFQNEFGLYPTNEMVYLGKYKDSNGNKYNPPFNNLMSYYMTYEVYRNKIYDHFKFTPQQIQRIRYYAERRAGWSNINLNCSGTAQSMPTNLTATRLCVREPVRITWQDNSTNETGYFIERSITSSTSGFQCIGGVDKNVHSFTDSLITQVNGVSYNKIKGTIYYRIRPSNSKNYSTFVAYNPTQQLQITPCALAKNVNNSNNLDATASIINVCKNSSFKLDFYFEGNFATNNQFKVQLSDQNGNFGANPLVIGTGDDSPVTATIPNQTFVAGSYKIRVVSTNPSITSSPSSDTYNIYPPLSQPILTATPTSIQVGASTLLTATGCVGTIYWSNNKIGTSQSVSPTQSIAYTAYCQGACKSDNATVNVTVTYPSGLETINYIESFFDTDPGFGNGTSLPITTASYIETTLPISTNNLSQGLHILNIRVRTVSNKWSVTHSQPIYVNHVDAGDATKITKIEYFYDNDPGFGNGNNYVIAPDSTIELESDFNTTGLTQGIHLLNVRVKDGSGRWSVTNVQPIAVIGYSNGNRILESAEYFIDNDPGIGNATIVNIPQQSDITSTFSINLSNITEGIHILTVRVKDSNNQWSIAYSQPFVKIANSLTTQITRVEYYIDADPGQGNGTSITYSPNLGQDIIGNVFIQVASITKGIHTISFRAKDSANNWSNLFSKTFEVESTPCSPVENIINPTPTGTTQAMERIFSTSKVNTGINANYRAGNSVLLSPGFETKSNVTFKITIEGCVND